MNIPEPIMLQCGAHESPGEGMCAMELCAYLTNEEFSDKPHCVCPIIANICRPLNDFLNIDNRNPFFKPLLPLLLGTNQYHLQLKRGWMCTDYVVRKLLPDKVAQASKLRALPVIDGPSPEALTIVRTIAHTAVGLRARNILTTNSPTYKGKLLFGAFKRSGGDFLELQAFLIKLCSMSDGYNRERDMMLRDQELQTRIRGALW